MKLYFNNSFVDVTLNDSPITSVIQGMYRHLQHIPINSKPWDSSYYLEMPHEQLVQRLVEFGNRVGVSVDSRRALEYDQNYFNIIHKIYEQSYNGDPAWLDFHEHIHICEKNILNPATLIIDYREKSGLLEKKFNIEWMSDTKTSVRKGDVYVNWAELGKPPYAYWKNSEPNDINRLCQLAKPWLKLRPRLTIALEDIDFMLKIKVDEFNNWWKEFEEPWCQHWNIPHWGIKEIRSVNVIGHINDIETVKSNLKQQIMPTRIQL